MSEREAIKAAMRAVIGYSSPQAGYIDRNFAVSQAVKACERLISEAVTTAQLRWIACPGKDATCPCQDGDACHYRGDDATPTPTELAVSEAVATERARHEAEIAEYVEANQAKNATIDHLRTRYTQLEAAARAMVVARNRAYGLEYAANKVAAALAAIDPPTAAEPFIDQEAFGIGSNGGPRHTPDTTT